MESPDHAALSAGSRQSQVDVSPSTCGCGPPGGVPVVPRDTSGPFSAWNVVRGVLTPARVSFDEPIPRAWICFSAVVEKQQQQITFSILTISKCTVQ